MKIINTKDIYKYTHKNIVNFIDYKKICDTKHHWLFRKLKNDAPRLKHNI